MACCALMGGSNNKHETEKQQSKQNLWEGAGDEGPRAPERLRACAGEVCFFH